MPEETKPPLVRFYEEYGWCQHDAAQKADGTPCRIHDPEARSFCVLAAMSKAYVSTVPSRRGERDVYYAARDRLGLALGLNGNSSDGLFHYNDAPTTTKEMIVAAAIKANV